MRNLCFAMSFSVLCAWALGQVPVSKSANSGVALPAGTSAQKVNEFLATLRPATSFQTLEMGNNLKLSLADIVESGTVRVGMSSTLPRTDAMWLLSMAAQPEGGGALFAAVTLEPSSQPDVSLAVKLYKTQNILLVVRAGGKYYGVHRHIKVGETSGPGPAK